MSEPLDLLIRARRAVVSTGSTSDVSTGSTTAVETSAAVGIRDGRIAAVETLDAELDAHAVITLGDDEVLLPGVVDSHVHVNDPGRTEWEGFTSATRAAAAGGVTTIIDMPLNSIPPTVDLAALELKRKTAQPQAFVDVGFWGGAVPGNVPDLRPLHDAGVHGFKCFLLHSGVDEFPPLDDEQLVQAMREIAGFDGLLIVHAEDAGCVHEAHGRQYDAFLHSRPRDAENAAVDKVIGLSKATGCRVHVLHVSSADALPLIADAKREGVRITAETCPHYLTFTAEEIPDGATQFKCCPPIREADNREQLWQGLRDGTLDIVVSDHSPSTVDLKALDTGDFGVAWGGISSLQLGLSVIWTGACDRGIPLADVVRWMAQGPADVVGLGGKGRIAVGADADFCVFAPDEEWEVAVRNLHHRNPVTPYDGRTLTGAVRSSWLRGERIDLSAGPRGRLLTRGD